MTLKYNKYNSLTNVVVITAIFNVLISLFMIYFSISSFVFLIKNPTQNCVQPIVHFGRTVMWNHSVESNELMYYQNEDLIYLEPILIPSDEMQQHSYRKSIPVNLIPIDTLAIFPAEHFYGDSNYSKPLIWF